MQKTKFTNIDRDKRQKGTKKLHLFVACHPLLRSLQNLSNKHMNILFNL